VTFYKGHQTVRNLVLPTPDKGSERQTYLGLLPRSGRRKKKLVTSIASSGMSIQSFNPIIQQNADKSAA
jgi:hypothetical protein